MLYIISYSGIYHTIINTQYNNNSEIRCYSQIRYQAEIILYVYIVILIIRSLLSVSQLVLAK